MGACLFPWVVGVDLRGVAASHSQKWVIPTVGIIDPAPAGQAASKRNPEMCWTSGKKGEREWGGGMVVIVSR